MKSYRLLLSILVIILILSACNLPSAKPTEAVNPNAVFTAAAQTVVVQLTQNALLNPSIAAATIVPPTVAPTIAAPVASDIPLPISTIVVASSVPTVSVPPTLPVIPTTACDMAQFIGDVSIPDGTTFLAGASFTKTWRLKNIGSCTWNPSYSLSFDSQSQMGGPAAQGMIGSVAPGAMVDVSVNLQAPLADGTYRGYWGIANSFGVRIPISGGANGRSFYVEIKVGSGVGAGTAAPGKFQVTSVGFSVAHTGTCAGGKYTVSATITTNKAGEVTYNWIRSDGGVGPLSSGSLTFNNAGSKVIKFEWFLGISGEYVDLYIDKPNHQNFTRAHLDCP